MHLKWKLLIVLSLVFNLWFYQCLPEPIFIEPNSSVLYDENGELLSATIAKDEQWRFPLIKRVPKKFVICLKTYEDKRFEHHIGVDILALGRAIYQNIREGKIISGASTLSMQLIRLSRKGQERTYGEKILELLKAIRLELRYSKKEILRYYSTYAPFGGNVVGLETAAWRYFGIEPSKLSWAESAMLAVLPNSPALVNPNRNREELLKKRNTLLRKLYINGEIDSTTWSFSVFEPLPLKTFPIAQDALHLLQTHNSSKKDASSAQVYTTLSKPLQLKVNQVLKRHGKILRENAIGNAAALIIEVESGDIKAYAGNIMNPQGKGDDGRFVDIIQARRSSGSILKPLLYASRLHEGEILPKTLIPDIPTNFNGYRPLNFTRSFLGAVQADQSLAQSLNVPAVHMLRDYGIAKFHHKLQEVGMSTLDRAPANYGLTLILGGAETSLWDLAKMYGGMARTLKNYPHYNGRYDPEIYRPPNYLKGNSYTTIPASEHSEKLVKHPPLSASAIWHTFEAMKKVLRPHEDQIRDQLSHRANIAWKTGTSFGFRDAWAVGCTPDYVVAVWAGNADGEGRPGLVGLHAAAPILFDIFNALPRSDKWFFQPFDEMAKIPVCKESGYRASTICESRDSSWVQKSGLKTLACPYHKNFHLDPSLNWQVNSSCISPSEIKHTPFFVLPPAMERFYVQGNLAYKSPPPFREGCEVSNANTQNPSMDWIYPRHDARIFIPYGLDGKRSNAIFELAHKISSVRVFWHLNGEFLGETRDEHKMPLAPQLGLHKLVCVDEFGEILEKEFEIVEKGK
ncbi:MAG: penicillin-binding protein 1C [Bacteroidia bacterium]|nr:penicillin-binding protein 1C [Bacteroidia bacterium]